MSKLNLVPGLLILSVGCGSTAPASPPDAGNTDNTDAGAQPEASPPIEAGPDVDNGAPSTTYPAFTIDAPQVVVAGDGTVLMMPKVIPVYFSADDTTTTGEITDFLSKLPKSTYWGPGVMEYGAGALTVAPPVQLTSADDPPATIDDSAIQTWLQGKITAGGASWPQPDSNTVYMLFYPSTTTITLQGSSSCSSFGGYHSVTSSNGANVAYAVVPNCGTFAGLTGIDAITGPTTHELIEATTDPYPSTPEGAYGTIDNNHIFWEFFLGGGEVGDMCAQFQTSFYTPADIGYAVQRTWSDTAAAQGHDPCVPSDGTPYYNSMPVLRDSIAVGGQFTTKGVHIPVGQSATVEVDLFSDADTGGPWTVTAIDTAGLMGAKTPNLAFTWDRASGVNGEKLHLTITVMSASQFMAEGFILHSALGTRHNVWFGLVGN